MTAKITHKKAEKMTEASKNRLCKLHSAYFGFDPREDFPKGWSVIGAWLDVREFREFRARVRAA